MSKAPRQRWPRYSLRTLLALIILVAIPLAWVAKEQRQSFREHTIADELRKQGILTITFGGPYERLEPYRVRPPQYWWDNLAQHVLGDRILEIDVVPPRTDRLREAVITPAAAGFDDLSLLSELSNLQFLNLGSTKVENIASLAELRKLQWLSLSNTPCTDLAPLAGLKHLRKIWLYKTAVSDLSPLAGLKSLKEVSVYQTRVDRTEIKALQKALPNCEIGHDPFP
jgi:hypothetical protein